MTDLPLITDTSFADVDHAASPLRRGEYEGCTFTTCTFRGGDLSGFVFRECTFVGCDFSNAVVNGTTFREARFEECKLTGVRFDQCNAMLLALAFDRCTANLAVFRTLDLRRTPFVATSLRDADFTNADCSSALFERCDLMNAQFLHTNLKSADLRTAFNYTIDPEVNPVRKARFSLAGVAGLLGKYGVVIE